MATVDQTYKDLLNKIIKDGKLYEDPNRKGVKRLQVPHYSFEHDLRESFPAITTKKLYWKGVVGELLWFLKGDTNIKYLIDNGINIWNKDAYNYYCKLCKINDIEPWTIEEFISLIKIDGSIEHGNLPNYRLGDLGRIYGAMWRNWIDATKGYNYKEEWFSIDQISNLIKNLKEKPLATDHIVTAWNPAELDDMALPPCHKGFQLMVYELTPLECAKYADKSKIPYKGPKYGFDLVWEQRSVDAFLGLPFNIASYALLAHIIGKIVNMVPGKLYGDLRNVHIYDNAIDGAKEQLARDVNNHDNCELEEVLFGTDQWFLGLNEILEFSEIKDFKLNGYSSYPSIKVPMLSRS